MILRIFEGFFGPLVPNKSQNTLACSDKRGKLLVQQTEQPGGQMRNTAHIRSFLRRSAPVNGPGIDRRDAACRGNLQQAVKGLCLPLFDGTPKGQGGEVKKRLVVGSSLT